MTGIDVDALTRKYLRETAKAVHEAIGDELCAHDALGDNCWHIARAAIPVVAARVEQDLRQQIERDLLARAGVARDNVSRVVTGSAKTRHSSMAEAYRIAAGMARGGSDAN